MNFVYESQTIFKVVVAIGSPIASAFCILLWTKGSAGLPGCGNGSACDAVTRSRWARVGHIPVTALGSATYLVMFLAAVLSLCKISWVVDQLIPCIQGGLAVAIMVTIIWFVILQATVLRRFCPFCMLIHAAGAVAVFGVLASVQLNEHAWLVTIGFGVLAAIVFILGQIIIPPVTFAVLKAPPVNVSEPSPGSKPEFRAEQNAPPVTGRQVKLLNGRVTILVDDWPVIGSRNAPHMLAFFFDHTCVECHHMHQLLVRVKDRFPTQLAFAMIAVPMHADCNPKVKCRDASRVQACAYARLGLAIHIANTFRFEQWDRWLVDSTEIQPFGMALSKANELADISRFDIRHADPVLDTKIVIAAETFESAGGGDVPALLLPHAILRGRVTDETALIRVFQQHLGLSVR